MQPSSMQHSMPQQCSHATVRSMQQCHRAPMQRCRAALVAAHGCIARRCTHTRTCTLRVHACACVCTCGRMRHGHLPTVPFCTQASVLHCTAAQHCCVCIAAVRSKRHKPKANAAVAVAGQERYPRLIDVKDQAIPLICPAIPLIYSLFRLCIFSPARMRETRRTRAYVTTKSLDRRGEMVPPRLTAGAFFDFGPTLPPQMVAIEFGPRSLVLDHAAWKERVSAATSVAEVRTYDRQQAASTRHATCNERASCNMQLTTCNVEHTTHGRSAS